jgi:serine/threonine protein kinase/Tol biopolymer transport system component
VRLTAASKLGPYEIVSAIGAGGMGEVYRARDPRLGRDVAIKVLPPSFSADPDRLRRFELEARAAAALNHPNILAVHDVGSHQGAPYLVSELLEGETLRERLSQPSRVSVMSPPDPTLSAVTTLSAIHAGLPVRRAVEYAVQIARGLAAAHDKNLVHRDLKPENVFITTDGRVKILDFGLAKLTQPDGASNATELPPTTPNLNTQAGMILGTMGYMAPEQVRGLPVDHRADIFAFGVILYEMLAGQRAFQGATSVDMITAILKEDPPDLPVAERHIPPALERIVDRCLEKSPSARFQSATDLAFALESLSSHSDRSEAGAVPTAASTRRSRARVAWIAAAVASIALIGTGAVTVRHLREASPVADPVRFVITPPENTPLSQAAPMAISPDGRQVVFGAVSKGQPTLWVRPLAELTAQLLPGTEGASFPFWSPDSRSIGFFAGEKLMKVQLSGGPPVPLCDAPAGRGGAWNDDNTIIFAPSPTAGLQKVASGGGPPAPVTTLGNGEGGHRWPWFLPDNRHFIYISVTGGGGRPTGTLWIGSLDSSERASVGPSDSNGMYASGHLLFVRGATLMAQPFDPERGKATGEPFPIAEQIVGIAATLKATFSLSASGALGYRPGVGSTSQLTWFDRTGKSLGAVGDPGVHVNLALSPDERHLAVSQAAVGNINIWILDLARAAAPSRFTLASGGDFDPVWSPDGAQLVFTSRRSGTFDLYWHAANGSGQDELLLKPDKGAGAPDWSRDGRFLAYSSGGDVEVLPLSGLGSSKVERGKPFAFLQTSFDEGDPAFSPDGRRMAYYSTESGQRQIYVQSFPAGGSKSRISEGGGSEPRWRGDGRELFFLAPDGMMMAARIDTAKDFKVTVPQPLFQTGITSIQNNHPYVVTRDGQRFLVPLSNQSAASQMTVVLNWLAGVQK